MSFERRFFFGCIQKDLEHSSGKEQLAAFSFDDAMGKTETVDGSYAENDSVVCSSTTNREAE